MNAISALGLAIFFSLATYAEEPMTPLNASQQAEGVNPANKSADNALAEKVYNTGFVNMSATYPFGAETFLIKCHKSNEAITEHYLAPLHGVSMNCKTADVYRKSGNLVQAGVGNGCHMIWGVIPYFHEQPSVSDGIGCPGKVVPDSNDTDGKEKLDLRMFSKPPFSTTEFSD